MDLGDPVESAHTSNITSDCNSSSGTSETLSDPCHIGRFSLVLIKPRSSCPGAFSNSAAASSSFAVPLRYQSMISVKCALNQRISLSCLRTDSSCPAGIRSHTPMLVTAGLLLLCSCTWNPWALTAWCLWPLRTAILTEVLASLASGLCLSRCTASLCRSRFYQPFVILNKLNYNK